MCIRDSTYSVNCSTDELFHKFIKSASHLKKNTSINGICMEKQQELPSHILLTTHQTTTQYKLITNQPVMSTNVSLWISVKTRKDSERQIKKEFHKIMNGICGVRINHKQKDK